MHATLTPIVAHYRAELHRRGPVAVNWGDLLVRFLASATKAVHAVAGPDADRRAAVVAAAVDFYKTDLAPLAWKATGAGPVVQQLAGPALEKLVEQLAGGVYDGLAAVFKSMAAPPPAPTAGAPPAPFNPY